LSRVTRIRGRVVGLLERRLLSAICARCLRWWGLRWLLGVRPLLLRRLGTVRLALLLLLEALRWDLLPLSLPVMLLVIIVAL
jgi:hypothetical protein